MTLTICIVHHKRIEKLKNCIRSVQETAPESVYEIWVHNNGYIDEEIEEYLQEQGVKYTHSEENMGLPEVRNWMFGECDSEYIMSLDDDMYVEGTWYEDALSLLNRDHVGIVGFSYVNSNTGEEVYGNRIDVADGVVSRYPAEVNDVEEVEDVPGGSMMFRRETLSDFEIDSQYRFGFADLDQSIQLMRSNWKQLVIGDITFTHDKGDTRDEAGKKRLDYNEIHKSYKKFCEKWDVRLEMKEHLYFGYLFAVPNPVLRVMSRVRQVIS